jgi:hypothetical protein
MVSKLASEEFLSPVQRYNDAVGPMFAEFRGRFPLDEHTEHRLSHSLGIFLSCVYILAMERMEKLRPEPLPREQWMVAPPEVKAEHIHWQRNLKYLKQRNYYFLKLLSPHANREPED